MFKSLKKFIQVVRVFFDFLAERPLSKNASMYFVLTRVRLHGFGGHEVFLMVTAIVSLDDSEILIGLPSLCVICFASVDVFQQGSDYELNNR